MQTRQLRFLFLATALGVLGGCGGSDDDTAAAPPPSAAPAPAAAAVDKYVGAWSMCVAQANGRSARENLTVTKTGDTTASFSSASTGYSGANCAGTVTATSSTPGSFTLVGTKTIAGETVDKADVVQNNARQKQVFLVRANGNFHTGVPTDEAGSAVDAEGYPGAIDPTGFSKV